uniref:DBH-like monooxygenase protein 1 homolog n=1 Tax=Petromyzon marinus TaxID=7757 RepID=A0AAJ7TK94_PETMA|nr:DBH-like monooxygenase protein 1 homolog [Petromyzon marinus]
MPTKMPLTTAMLVAAMLVAAPAAIAASGSLDVEGELPLSAQASEGDLQLSWGFDADRIVMEVRVRTLGWVAVGFSPTGSMAGSDVALGWVDGTGAAHFMDGHVIDREVLRDGSQDYSAVWLRENGTHTHMRLQRPLRTCDSHDMELNEDTIRVVWAYGAKDPASEADIPYHGPTTRGSMSVQLLGHGPPSEQPLPSNHAHFDVNYDKFEIPAQSTFYQCEIFPVPKLDRKHHLIKVVPRLQANNEAFVHHILLYTCSASVNASHVGASHECNHPNMPDSFTHCFGGIMAGWAVGGGVSGPSIAQLMHDIFSFFIDRGNKKLIIVVSHGVTSINICECAQRRAVTRVPVQTFDYPPEAGFSLGAQGDPQFVMLETHYDNPAQLAGEGGRGLKTYRFPRTPDTSYVDKRTAPGQKPGRCGNHGPYLTHPPGAAPASRAHQTKPGVADSSGLRFYITPELRAYDSGMLEVGVNPQPTHFIPPMTPSFMSYAVCPTLGFSTLGPHGDALRGSLPRPAGVEPGRSARQSGEIQVFATILHAHLLGAAMQVRHFRQGKQIGHLGRDMGYDFNYQEARYLKELTAVLPGDELITECTYRSTSRSHTTTVRALTTTTTTVSSLTTSLTNSNNVRTKSSINKTGYRVDCYIVGDGTCGVYVELIPHGRSVAKRANRRCRGKDNKGVESVVASTDLATTSPSAIVSAPSLSPSRVASFPQGGLSTQDEMCIAFLYYYPRVNVSRCLSLYDMAAVAPSLGFTVTPEFPYTVLSPPEAQGVPVFLLYDRVNWTESTVRGAEAAARDMEHLAIHVGEHSSSAFLAQHVPKIPKDPEAPPCVPREPPPNAGARPSRVPALLAVPLALVAFT